MIIHTLSSSLCFIKLFKSLNVPWFRSKHVAQNNKDRQGYNCVEANIEFMFNRKYINKCKIFDDLFSINFPTCFGIYVFIPSTHKVMSHLKAIVIFTQRDTKKTFKYFQYFYSSQWFNCIRSGMVRLVSHYIFLGQCQCI